MSSYPVARKNKKRRCLRDTRALMHLHVWVCMLHVRVTKHEARYFKYVYYSDSSHTCCFSQHGVATTLKKIQNNYKKGLKVLHSNTKTNSNGLHFYIWIHSNISNGLILARRPWVRPMWSYITTHIASFRLLPEGMLNCILLAVYIINVLYIGTVVIYNCVQWYVYLKRLQET